MGILKHAGRRMKYYEPFATELIVSIKIKYIFIYTYYLTYIFIYINIYTHTHISFKSKSPFKLTIRFSIILNFM